jgi:hypothetical protein
MNKYDTTESKVISKLLDFTYLKMAHSIEVSRDGYNFFVLQKKGKVFTIHYETETKKYLIETIIMDIKTFETLDIKVFKSVKIEDVKKLIEQFFSISVYNLVE